jgi:hypothetical protein
MSNLETRKRHAQIMANKIWVVRDTDEKYITKDLLNDYLEQGYILGRYTQEQTREKMKNRQRKTCCYCGITCVIANYNRWHGNNCRSKG